MEHVKCVLDGEEFDKAIRTQPGGPPVLSEGGDVAFYFKNDATSGGKPGCCIAFTVQLPDGTFAKAQAVLTLALLDMVGMCVRGWRSGGHLKG